MIHSVPVRWELLKAKAKLVHMNILSVRGKYKPEDAEAIDINRLGR
jgi:hypothetical protein